MNAAGSSNKLNPGNDHWLWRSLVPLSSGRGRCESLVRAHSRREKRSRERGQPNSTKPQIGFEIGLHMFHLGTLSLTNAKLNTALFSAHVDTLFWLIHWSKECILLRILSFYLHIFLVLTAPSTGLCTWQMQIIGLNLLNANSKNPYVRTIGPGGHGEWEQNAHQFPSSLLPGVYHEDLQKWTKASPLNFFWQMMTFLTAFCTRSLWTNTLLESVEQT